MNKEVNEFIKSAICYGAVTILVLVGSWFFWSAVVDFLN